MSITIKNNVKMSGKMTASISSSASPVVSFNSEAYGGAATLSNNNLTVTSTNEFYSTTLSTYEILDGNKYMFSVTMNVFDGSTDYSGVGFSPLIADWTNYLGTDSRNFGLFTSGNVYFNTTTDIGVTFDTNGDVIDIAIDRVNHKCWWRVNGGNWNNNPSDNPATNSGGFDISSLSGTPLYLAVTTYTNVVASQFTINSTSSYSVPSGFTFVSGSLVASTPLPLQFNPYYTTYYPDVFDFSNSNLSVELVENNFYYTSCTTHMISNGEKLMFSVTLNTVGAGLNNFNAVGFNSLIDNSISELGDSNNQSVGYYVDGTVYFEGGTLTTLSTFGAGDVIDMAVDKVNNLWYFRVNGGNWNNNPSANPASSSGGLTLASLNTFHGVLAVTMEYSTKFTINTTSAYSVPSGFTFVPGTPS